MALSARRLLLSSANKVRWYSSQTPGKAYVVGVGMTKFEKPKGEAGRDFPEMAFEAGKKALDDAKVDYSQIEQAVTGYVFGDSTKGQRAVYELGRTGIPVYNTNNNCSTGASALYLAKQLVSGRVADCVLALGFEKMQKGALNLGGQPGANPLDLHMSQMTKFHGGPTKAPGAPWIFGMGGQHHMKLYGTTKEQFARVAEKNHRHSVNNPYAQFQNVYSLDDILASKEIFGPITKLQCSPTSDGAAAAIVASERFVKEHKLEDQAVEIAAMKMVTDLPESFDDPIGICGIPMARKAAAAVYEEAGVTPNDIDVIELHDCFSTNELMTYEALGLCEAGQGGRLIDEGQVTYGGKWVVNPSGGLISKGHPLGATGIAQCAELCWQLRGQADKRQVSGAKIGMQHNLGLGGAAVLTIFKR